MTAADISKLLFFTSIIVWLLPPFKQFKGKYFIFFLILAFMDPINVLFFFIIKSSFLHSQILILLNYGLLLSIIKKDLLKKHWIWIILITLALFTPTIFHFNRKEFILTILLLQSFITLIILKNLITNFISFGKLSLFHLVFLFYQFTMITKFSNLLVGFADATAFFILTSIAQIIFGLFFSIYREDKSGLVI